MYKCTSIHVYYHIIVLRVTFDTLCTLHTYVHVYVAYVIMKEHICIYLPSLIHHLTCKMHNSCVSYMLDEVQKIQHRSVNKTYSMCMSTYMCMYSSICTSVPAQLNPHVRCTTAVYTYYMLDEVQKMQHRSVNKIYSIW